MAKRLNVLRHGGLRDVLQVMDGDEPLDKWELRALVFNLADRASDLQSQVDALRDRVTDLELSKAMKQAEDEGEFEE